MKYKLQKIKEEAQSLCSEISSDFQTAQNNVRQIGDEYHRVTSYSRNSMTMIDEIDAKFEKATKLTKTDTAFLFTATALQCLRQYFLTPLTERKGHQEAADEVKEKKEHSDRTHRLYNPSLEEIISNPVPFDATMGSKRYGALSGFNGPDHRYATPGHDPVLGLLFGTANIATSTLTNWRIESFHIYTGTIGLAKGNHDIFTQRAQTPLVFSNLFFIKVSMEKRS